MIKTPEQKLVIPEVIHFRSIQIIEFQIHVSDTFRQHPVKPDRNTFSIAKSIDHIPGENKARYRLFFMIDALDSNNEPLGLDAMIGIEFHMEIENLSSNILEKNGQLTINTNLAATILGMSYSTSRGIILEKTQNTFFGGIILPCIDPYKVLLEKDDEKEVTTAE